MWRCRTCAASGRRRRRFCELWNALSWSVWVEMQLISQVLQLSIVIDRGRMLSAEPQGLQKLHLFLRRASAERPILEEMFQARLDHERLLRPLFHKLESPQAPGSQTAVQYHFHGKG